MRWTFYRDYMESVCPCRTGELLQEGTAVIHSCVQSGRRPQARILTTFFRRKEEAWDPYPEVEARQDFWSTMWEITYVGIMLLHERNFLFRRTIFQHLWITWCAETNANDHWCTSWGNHRGLLEFTWRQSQCVNPGSVWHGSSCSTEIHQKDLCGVKADWRKNRLLKDVEIFGRKNGQTCRKAFSAKPKTNGRKTNQKWTWTLRERSEAFAPIPDGDPEH